VQNSLAAIVVARELGVKDDVIRKALAGFKGVGRRFSKIGEWKGAAIIDDYAHNPFKIAAALRAARQAYSGPVVAVVQPHRYTRLRDTFEQFAKCLNDADVRSSRRSMPRANSRSKALTGIPTPNRCAPMATEIVLTIDGEADLAAAFGAAPQARRRRGRVGRGLDHRLDARSPEKAGEWRVMMTRPCDMLPPVRGTYTHDAPLKDQVWFRAGGPAEILFRPADAEDLATFLVARPGDLRLSVIGVGSNLLVRDGGIPGVVIRLPAAFGRSRLVLGRLGAPESAPAPPRWTPMLPRPRQMPALPGWNSCAACLAPSAAR